MKNAIQMDCRRSFADALLDEGRNNRNIVVAATDSRGSSLTDRFARELPNQFVEAGIAEQNAVGMAVGMGLSGKNVFVCAPASFLSMRSAEQAKVDVAYNHANVKLIGMSAGLSYAALGATHHAVSDFAVMASLPGMMVLSPSDAVQAGAMARYLCSFDGPAYVRMGRGASPDVYERSQACFHPGKINVLAHGTDGVLLATGETVYEALAAAQALKRLGISVSVLDCCSIKPFDQETLSQEAVGKWALTIEEHGALGGIGDAASRVLGPAGIRQDRLCVPDEWAPCASSQTLRKLYNLDFDGIIKKVMQLRGSF